MATAGAFKSYIAGPSNWNNVATWTEAWSNKTWALGDTVRPTTPDGFSYRCTTIGSGGASEPTWNATLDATTSGTVAVFTCQYSYPGQASDRADTGTINNGHTVTYNVNSTNELGAWTIASGGLLTFTTAASTVTNLAFGNVDFTITGTGELQVGADASTGKIPSTSTATITFNTSGDNAKGILGTGTLKCYGDPAYYGSDIDDYIAANFTMAVTGTTGQTFTTITDMSAIWQNGNELLLHKGTNYGTTGWTNDFALVTITGITGTTVTCNVTSNPGGSATFNQYGAVLNVSRNVVIRKAGAIQEAPGQVNTNRPYCKPLIITGYDCQFWGMYQVGGQGNSTENETYLRAVSRNGNNGFYTTGGTQQLTDCISYSCSTGINGRTIGSGGYFCGCSSNGIIASNDSYCTGIQMFGNVGGARSIKGTFNGIYIYANMYDLNSQFTNITLIGCYIGISKYVTNFNSTWYWPLGIVARGCSVTSGTITRQNPELGGYIAFENYNLTLGDNRVFHGFGVNTTTAPGIISVTASSDPGAAPPSGSTYVPKITPGSRCDSTHFIDVPLGRYWMGTGSATHTFYVQSTFTATMDNTLLSLKCEWLSSATDGTIATTTSTNTVATRTSSSDWAKTLSVTVNPLSAGWMTFYIRVATYESGKYIWIDPVVVFT